MALPFLDKKGRCPLYMGAFKEAQKSFCFGKISGLTALPIASLFYYLFAFLSFFLYSYVLMSMEEQYN